MDELDRKLLELAQLESAVLPESYVSRMDHLEEEIRTGSLISMKTGGKRKRLVLVIAAAVVLSVSAVAAGVWQVRLLEMNSADELSYYSIAAEVPRIPQEDFSDAVYAAMEEIRQAFLDYSPEDSWYPGDWQAYLDSWSACEDFLGISLVNPLEKSGLEQGTYNGIAFDSGLLFGKDEESHCLVQLHGNAEGVLQSANIQGGYVSGLNRLTLNISLWPEESDWSMERGVAWGEQYVTFETEETATGSGQAVFFVMSSAPFGGYVSADAYFVMENGLYQLGVSAPAGPGQQAEVRELMEEVLQMF